jgi:hypothetical protein
VDPVLRFEGASHPAARTWLRSRVERQLALRLNRSNEATSCWSWADLSPCLCRGPRRLRRVGTPTASRRAVISANARAAQWRPRERQDGLFKLFKEDKPVATKHLRCLPYEVCGGRRITYIECQVRSGCLVDSVCERRHREGASDWCEVARSACLSRSQGSLAALLDLAALSLDDATPYLAPPQLALRDLQLLDGAMATEFCGLRTHSLDTT